MPNLCINKLIIKGDSAVIEKFIEDNSGDGSDDRFLGDLDFRKLVPEPDNIDALPHDEQNKWYEDNWGVNYVDDTYGWIKEEGLASLIFFTPWGCPVAWLENVAKVYPSLEVTNFFYDEGNEFYARLFNMKEDLYIEDLSKQLQKYFKLVIKIGKAQKSKDSEGYVEKALALIKAQKGYEDLWNLLEEQNGEVTARLEELSYE